MAHRARFSDAEALAIQVEYHADKGLTYAALAARHDCSSLTIGDIVRERNGYAGLSQRATQPQRPVRSAPEPLPAIPAPVEMALSELVELLFVHLAEQGEIELAGATVAVSPLGTICVNSQGRTYDYTMDFVPTAGLADC